jgi:hypothetical protein
MYYHRPLLILEQGGPEGFLPTVARVPRAPLAVDFWPTGLIPMLAPGPRLQNKSPGQSWGAGQG